MSEPHASGAAGGALAPGSLLGPASGNRGAGGDERSVRLGRLGRSEPGEVLLAKASNAVYSAGHLLFALRDGSPTLWAQPFDTRRGVLRGPPRRLVDVNTDAAGMSLLRISPTPDGDLVYLGTAGQWSTDQAWFDLQGERVGTLVGGAPWFAPRFSPDGRRAALSMTNLQDGDTHLWIVDTAEGGSPRRLTFEKGYAYSVAWSPDGRRVAYAAERQEQSGIYGRAVAGGPEELLLESSDLDEGELDWSPDGRHLLLQVWNAPTGNYDMHLLDLAGGSERPLLATAADERVARWSGDGAFIAYTSNESGAEEVYLRRLDGDGKWQVSDGGGSMPRWSADGGELYYLRPDGRLAAVAMTLGAEVALGRPRLLFDRRLPVTRWLTYEPHPDGERLLIDYPPPETLDVPVRLLQSWPALLDR